MRIKFKVSPTFLKMFVSLFQCQDSDSVRQLRGLRLPHLCPLKHPDYVQVLNTSSVRWIYVTTNKTLPTPLKLTFKRPFYFSQGWEDIGNLTGQHSAPFQLYNDDGKTFLQV